MSRNPGKKSSGRVAGNGGVCAFNIAGKTPMIAKKINFNGR